MSPFGRETLLDGVSMRGEVDGNVSGSRTMSESSGRDASVWVEKSGRGFVPFDENRETSDGAIVFLNIYNCDSSANCRQSRTACRM